MLFDTEYNVDRLLREQPSLGRFSGADRRVRFPSGQTRRGQPFAMASIWNGYVPPATGSTNLSVQEYEPFLRELTNTVLSTLAFCVLDGGPTLQVSFLPAPDAARVGFALLTPHPWRPVRRNLDDSPPPLTQVARAQEPEDLEDYEAFNSWNETYSDGEQVEPPGASPCAPCWIPTTEERESILAEERRLRRTESEWANGDGEVLVAMASDVLPALPMRFTLPQTHRSFSVTMSVACPSL
jgi:hypothetical protein